MARAGVWHAHIIIIRNLVFFFQPSEYQGNFNHGTRRQYISHYSDFE